MNQTASIVFLLDFDNTVLDNDHVIADLKAYLTSTFGEECQQRYWTIFEQWRAELGYADYLGALQRYRAKNLRDPDFLQVSFFLLDYPFADRLYPDALNVIKHLAVWGPTVILTDGDVGLQRARSNARGCSTRWRVA